MRRGLCGLRVFIAGHTMAAKDARLDDPKSFPAWDLASELGITVSVQLRAAGIPQLETVLRRFPRARILLDHMARPASRGRAALRPRRRACSRSRATPTCSSS